MLSPLSRCGLPQCGNRDTQRFLRMIMIMIPVGCAHRSCAMPGVVGSVNGQASVPAAGYARSKSGHLPSHVPQIPSVIAHACHGKVAQFGTIVEDDWMVMGEAYSSCPATSSEQSQVVPAFVCQEKCVHCGARCAIKKAYHPRHLCLHYPRILFRLEELSLCLLCSPWVGGPKS